MFIADLHIHSKFSRATSRDMNVENIAAWAKLKGIKLMGTGDFTHPDWLDELEANLQPVAGGLFKHNETYFMLTAEVCNIFFKNNKTRKIHNVLIVPSFAIARKINHELEKFGNLEADGRPILDLPAKNLVKIVMGVSTDCMIIPGHIWTPWFSLFGSNFGFDSIEECFEEEAKNIFGLETGLSSDPPMNWRLSKLDRYTLISNSDAHSPKKIGREANVFDCKLDYQEISEVIKKKDKERFLYTIEFFPEEGKYHYDGHRICNLCLSPGETRKYKEICPQCGRKITVGVMHRVENLADREEGTVPNNAIAFKHLIPLAEIIANALKIGEGSLTVEKEYRRLVQRLKSEFEILLHLPENEIRKFIPAEIAQAIINVRKENVKVSPGYDGVYGKIEISRDDKKQAEQLSLF